MQQLFFLTLVVPGKIPYSLFASLLNFTFLLFTYKPKMHIQFSNRIQSWIYRRDRQNWIYLSRDFYWNKLLRACLPRISVRSAWLHHLLQDREPCQTSRFYHSILDRTFPMLTILYWYDLIFCIYRLRKSIVKVVNFIFSRCFDL